ncbi:Mu-like prophage protein [Mesorhizobium sp. ORS 3359]|nr:Mu-like prophage protein [Mesorhizobium sp. ORS 3359]
MATEGIQLRVVDQAVMATLDRIERLATNPAAIMAEIASFLVSRTQRHFQTETGPDGKWQPLSPRTAARRIGSRQRGNAHILRDTGRLYQSIVGESSDTEASVGTNVLYAAIHQLGGEVKIPEREQDIHLGRTNRGKRFVKASAKRKETMRVTIGAHTIEIPARPFLYLDKEDEAEIKHIVENAFRAEADGAGP